MMPARCVQWPPRPAGALRVDHVHARAHLAAQLRNHRHARIEQRDADVPAGDAAPAEAEAAGPRLVGTRRGVGDRHLPAHDVVAGNLWDVGVGGELIETPRRHLDDRAAREGAPDPQSVARRERRDLLGRAADDDCRRRGIAGIQMPLEIV